MAARSQRTIKKVQGQLRLQKEYETKMKYAESSSQKKVKVISPCVVRDVWEIM